MNISLHKEIDVTEQDILDFITDYYEESYNEDGTINKEGVLHYFAENVAFILCNLLHTNEDCLDAQYDAQDHEDLYDIFEEFVNNID